MIVVVEGPSAAGKTNWIARHCAPAIVVPEVPPHEMGHAPDRREDPRAAAQFWAALNANRWQQAKSTEDEYGLAICDSDPFKLHYIWSLWRTGHASHDQWLAELADNRKVFAEGQVGLADLILVTIPDRSTLTKRRQTDHSRRRRNFDLHLQLTAPLEQWYRAVEKLDPTRVIWQLPSTGVPAPVPRREPDTGPRLLEALLAYLPAI